MTEHPLYSDKDNRINNLEAENTTLKAELDRKIKECVKLDERLEDLQGQVKRHRAYRIKNFFKGLLYLAFGLGCLGGAGYGIYLIIANESYLNERCTRLCRMTIGDYSVEGEEENTPGCGDKNRHCACTTRGNTKVKIAKTTYEELSGDLNKLVKNLNIEAWKACMRLQSDDVQEVSCNRVPWKRRVWK